MIIIMIIHHHTRTRCAAEAIAMETGPTLTGERALGVVADGITMATGRLALVNICMTEKETMTSCCTMERFGRSGLCVEECTSAVC